MKKLNWEHVTAFDKDGNAHHFAVHVTQKGEPNKRDVKRILAEGCRIPLRYSDGGIRLLNPALPWPEEVLLSGDPPEVYARLGLSQAFKLSASDLAWMGSQAVSRQHDEA